jgi:RimJ/RimL family protein N-acetyltransferase
MHLEPYEYKHNARLMEIAKISEPWIEWHRALFDASLAGRQGFVIVDRKSLIIGCITYSDYHTGSDVTIHCSVLPDHHGRWLTKAIYKQVFDYVFITLGLPRCSGYLIEGCTPLGFHERLGFKKEGIKRDLVRIQETLRNVHIYGMLESERRW